MDMLITDMPGVNEEALPLTNQLDDSLELLFNVLVFQDLSSVFWSPDKMVLADIGTMA